MSNLTKVKTQSEIKAMRDGGKMMAEILAVLEAKTVYDMSTWDVDMLAREEIAKRKTKSGFLGYGGFPGVICVSLNDEVIHAIPRKDKIIREGDVVSFDFGIINEGMNLDAGRTFGVGKIYKDAQKLIDDTKQSFFEGVSVMRDGARIGDYGAVVEKFLKDRGYGILRNYAGHGIGKYLHEDPMIPNYGDKGTGFILREGMTVAFEPMVTLGEDDTYEDEDGWTVKTIDGSLSAYYENTVLITKKGVEILTKI
jgi:methionyl aminopeptidase